ncbi:MAG: tetratricopeptide repeat protein, partial [Fibrobacterota bacterium]
MGLPVLNRENLQKIYDEDSQTLLFARLAYMLLRDGDAKKALSIAEDGVEKHPDYTAGKLVLAQCCIEQKEYDPAHVQLTEILRKEPQNPKALALFAQTAMERGQKDTARKVTATLRSLFPHDPAAQKAEESKTYNIFTLIAAPPESEEQDDDDWGDSADSDSSIDYDRHDKAVDKITEDLGLEESDTEKEDTTSGDISSIDEALETLETESASSQKTDSSGEDAKEEEKVSQKDQGADSGKASQSEIDELLGSVSENTEESSAEEDHGESQKKQANEAPVS